MYKLVITHDIQSPRMLCAIFSQKDRPVALLVITNLPMVSWQLMHLGIAGAKNAECSIRQAKSMIKLVRSDS